MYKVFNNIFPEIICNMFTKLDLVYDCTRQSFHDSLHPESIKYICIVLCLTVLRYALIANFL